MDTFAIQVHWQNRSDPRETKFVDHGEFDNGADAMEWASKVIEARFSEMPEGYCPMVCTEDYCPDCVAVQLDVLRKKPRCSACTYRSPEERKYCSVCGVDAPVLQE